MTQTPPARAGNPRLRPAGTAMTDPPIYEQLMQEFPRYDHPEISPATSPPEAAMGLAQDITNDIAEIKAKLGETVDRVAAFAEQRIPQATDLLSSAETNPVLEALEEVTHVPQTVVNGILAGAAKTLLDLDDEFAKVAPEAPAGPAEPVDAPEPVEETAGTPNLQAGAEPAPAS